MPHLLGVLGGMGPAATADFLSKLVRCTPAARDADHIPVLVSSIPQIPDRSEAILHGAQSPLPAMRSSLQKLVLAGADCVAIPCNTAHHWFDELRPAATGEMIHIADAVMRHVDRHCLASDRIGLLATPGTIEAKIYPRRSGGRCAFVEPRNSDLHSLILPGIRAVKAGRPHEAEPLFAAAAVRLFDEGATCVVMACTEIPLAMQSALAFDQRFVDSTTALAEECVRRFVPQAASARSCSPPGTLPS